MNGIRNSKVIGTSHYVYYKINLISNCYRLLNKNNDRDRRVAYVHLYGVAQACALIAKKRGVDIELAIMAGMLHDLYTYKRKDEVRHLGMVTLYAPPYKGVMTEKTRKFRIWKKS
ncbi:MAG: hypothetical protein K0S47_4769 [Herbinix sp.]|nr:hypothetical protein [Herbinix sp.]